MACRSHYDRFDLILCFRVTAKLTRPTHAHEPGIHQFLDIEAIVAIAGFGMGVVVVSIVLVGLGICNVRLLSLLLFLFCEAAFLLMVVYVVMRLVVVDTVVQWCWWRWCRRCGGVKVLVLVGVSNKDRRRIGEYTEYDSEEAERKARLKLA